MVERYILTITGKNRIGVLSDISDVVANQSGNIEAVRQIILDGYFCVVMKVSFPAGMESQAIRKDFAVGYPAVVVMDWDYGSENSNDSEQVEPFILAVNIKDSPGNLATIADCLSTTLT